MRRFKGFQSFATLVNFAENTNDMDFISKIRIVKTYANEDLPSMVDTIKRHCSYAEKDADYIFTTTHKSKGLEWKTVLLLGDFLEIPMVDKGEILFYLRASA